MNQYKIEHVRDFLQVPEDRIDSCLEEFKSFLQLGRAHMEITAEVNKLLTPSESLKGCVGAYVWIDDGKQDVTINYSFDFGQKGN